MADPADTICALSTAPGHSGLAVVRVSGTNSLKIYKKIFRHKKGKHSPESRTATLGRIVDPVAGTEIDEAVAIHYYGPKSYTGEDLTEYSIHGSPALVAALLDCICRHGARIAEPGEFTMRAFIQGKMDLLQAEAVDDIINATTLYQAQVAARQRYGDISRAIRPIQQRIIDIIVQLESAVEFVEENISVESRAVIMEKLSDTRYQIRRWIDSFRKGRIIRKGFELAVIGRPNVGKSSLFNALLMQDRSIVMDMPGTTRDIVSEYTSIGGIPVRLLDTAGIHDSIDSTEKIGVDRAYRAISDADAVLFVLDRNLSLNHEDYNFKEKSKNLKSIFVFNKIDLVSHWTSQEIDDFSEDCPWIEVSAKTGEGIEELRSMIFNNIFGMENIERNDLLITNLRHCHCLEAAEDEIEKAEKTFKKGLSEEFALLHLHKGLKNIGTITGETSVEDILGAIFSRFCIGK